VYVVLGFVMLLLLGVVAVFWIGIQTNTRRSAEAAAEVVAAEEVRWWNAADNQMESGYNLRYRYVVAGATYEAADEDNTWYRPGMAVKVCLAPTDPRDHVLTAADQPCGAKVRRI